MAAEHVAVTLMWLAIVLAVYFGLWRVLRKGARSARGGILAALVDSEDDEEEEALCVDGEPV